MVKSLTVRNYRNESAKIVLHDENPSHGMLISQIDGLGPPKASINLLNFASKDGGLFNSSRVDERNVVIHLYFTDAPTIEDARLNVYKYFPIQKRCRLRIETDRRKAQIYGYVESVEPEIFSDMEGAQVSIICPDPYWRSTEDGGTQETSFYGENSIFEFPFSNESLSERLIELSRLSRYTEKIIDYGGDVGCGIYAVLSVVDSLDEIGVPASFEMSNLTTGETLRLNFNGLVLSDNDEVRIDTTFGNKSVFLYHNGSRTNLLNRLDPSSAWIQLTRGENTIRYSVGTVTQQAAFNLVVQNSVWYEGV